MCRSINNRLKIGPHYCKAQRQSIRSKRLERTSAKGLHSLGRRNDDLPAGCLHVRSTGIGLDRGSAVAPLHSPSIDSGAAARRRSDRSAAPAVSTNPTHTRSLTHIPPSFFHIRQTLHQTPDTSTMAEDIKALQSRLADLRKEKDEVDKRLERIGPPLTSAGAGLRRCVVCMYICEGASQTNRLIYIYVYT